MNSIDVIAAVRNEVATLETFVDEILSLQLQDIQIRLFFVEDGSTDNTIEILDKLTESFDQVRYCSILNEYGQGMALSYGILQSDADAVITIDADGSFPAEVVKKMIEKFQEGYEIVQGNRIAYERKEMYRKIGSKIYFTLFTLLTGVNLYTQNVHFRLMSRKAVGRYKRTPACWYSVRLKKSVLHRMKTISIPFEAIERVRGQSKFNFKRLLGYAYLSFLTLTGVPMFIGLSLVLLVIAALTWIFLSKIVAGLLLILIFLNMFSYIRAQLINYTKKMVLKKKG